MGPVSLYPPSPSVDASDRLSAFLRVVGRAFHVCRSSANAAEAMRAALSAQHEVRSASSPALGRRVGVPFSLPHCARDGNGGQRQVESLGA
eukprot:6194053-Pleurochrysis_carterae.AAC.1